MILKIGIYQKNTGCFQDHTPVCKGNHYASRQTAKMAIHHE